MDYTGNGKLNQDVTENAGPISIFEEEIAKKNKGKVMIMKLKLKKDIVIKKGTIFDDIAGSKSHYYDDMYDTVIALDNDTCARIIVSAENKQYFEVIK